jgi:prevent-host-death family protein
MTMPAGITVSASGFKAKCLSLLRKLETGELARVMVTRRGKPVALIVGAATQREPLKDMYGFQAGLIQFSPDYDPFEQVIDEPSDPFLDKPRSR